MDELLKIADYLSAHPLLLGAGVLVLIIFRQAIGKHIPCLTVQLVQVAAGRKKLADIAIKSQAVPEIHGSPFRGSYTFPRSVLAASQRAFHAELLAVVDYFRESGTPLTFSFVDTQVINEKAMDALKKALQLTIQNNNIELVVVLPGHHKSPDVEAFRTWLKDEIKRENSRSIVVRDDIGATKDMLFRAVEEGAAGV